MDDISLLKLMESALQEENDRYQSLFRLSQEQIEILRDSEPDVEQTARIMNLKMQVVEDIQLLESQHLPVKERWEALHSTFSPEERETIRLWRDRTLELIERLQAMEDTIAQRIAQCESEVNRQLQDLQKEKQAARAYLQIVTGPPRYIDRKK